MDNRNRLLTEDIFKQVSNILEQAGFTWYSIKYPGWKRSIDIVASRGNSRLVMKIVEDLEDLDSEEVRDLQKSASAYDAIPLLASNSCGKRKMEDDVVYVKSNINAVTPNLLRNFLLKGEKPIIVKMKGSYLLRINKEVFSRLRTEMGLSLGAISEMLGVSRKSVYLYERGELMITLERAIQLAERFGEDIFDEIDLFKDRFSDSPRLQEDDSPKDPIEEELINVLKHHAVKFYRFSRTAVDVALSAGESVSLIKVVDSEASTLEKIENAEKMVTGLRSRLVLVRRKEDVREVKNILRA